MAAAEKVVCRALWQLEDCSPPPATCPAKHHSAVGESGGDWDEVLHIGKKSPKGCVLVGSGTDGVSVSHYRWLSLCRGKGSC